MILKKKKLRKFVYKYRHYITVIPLLFLVMLMLPSLRKFIVVLILFFLGAISTMHKRFISIGIGCECYVFGSVIVSIIYGPKAGALFGFITSFVSTGLSGRIIAPTFSLFIATAIIGYVSNPLYGIFGIFALGMIMTLLFNLIVLPVYFFLGTPIFKVVVHFFSNVFLNILLFKYFAPLFLMLMRS